MTLYVILAFLVLYWFVYALVKLVVAIREAFGGYEGPGPQMKMDGPRVTRLPHKVIVRPNGQVEHDLDPVQLMRTLLGRKVSAQKLPCRPEDPRSN